MTEDLIPAVVSARSILFVPGTRPDRFGKALASGADCIVIDLEDSVEPDRKDEARRNVERWRAAGGAGIVRVNDAGSAWFDDDIAALCDFQCVVMLPKTIDADQVAVTVDRMPTGSAVIPILESAVGILEARSICSAAGVPRAAFGNGDLALELGVDHADRAALWYARSALVMASAACLIAAPIDGVTTAIDDDQQLRADVQHGKALGYTGRLCIHPRQVPIVNAAFGASESEIVQAQRIVEAAGSGAVAVVDGRMIDKPIVDRARRVLDRQEILQS